MFVRSVHASWRESITQSRIAFKPSTLWSGGIPCISQPSLDPLEQHRPLDCKVMTRCQMSTCVACLPQEFFSVREGSRGIIVGLTLGPTLARSTSFSRFTRGTIPRAAREETSLSRIQGAGPTCSAKHLGLQKACSSIAIFACPTQQPVPSLRINRSTVILTLACH